MWGVGGVGGEAPIKCAYGYPVTVYTRVCVLMWLQDCREAALVSLACQLTPSALHMKGPGCVGGQEKERGAGDGCVFISTL